MIQKVSIRFPTDELLSEYDPVSCEVNRRVSVDVSEFSSLRIPFRWDFFFFFFPSIRGALIPDSNCYVRVGK